MSNTTNEYTFKTLLSKKEYDKLAEMFKDEHSNTQTNYYFDTSRFTLKASKIGLRVRKRDKYELTLKRKRGYALQEINEVLTEEQFNSFLETGIIPSEDINTALSEVIKEQLVKNYMTLTTFRITFPYSNGKLSIDKCTYVDTTDYELEYEASSYEEGKREFVTLVKGFGIAYKKSQAKIQRAYDALRRKI